MIHQSGNAANQSVQRSMRIGFISDVINELRKVEWPTWATVVRLSVMVIAVSATIGVVLGIADFILTFVINKLILGV